MSILTDENWKDVLPTILRKDKTKTTVGIEFDTDNMTGYAIQVPVSIFLVRL